MRALSKRAAEPGLELIDVPEPHPGPREVKIKVLRTGLCGTDLHILKWDEWAANTLRPPVIPGHEFFGEVVEVGADVMSIEPGQFASGEGHVVCGTCRNCRAGRSHVCARTSSVGVNRDGAFAEYVVIPATNVWVQPADMDPSLGAVFDPLGNAVHTALTYPIAGEDILITGAGPIGLMAAAIARHVGARNIVMTDVSDERLELAPAVGVNTSINVGRRRIREAQAELGMTEGFDIGLEMSGSPQATQEMIDNMMHGGRIAMLGLPSQEYSINWSTVITSMLTIKGIYGRQMYETWYAMSAMLSTSSALRKAVTNVISDVVPASDWQRAFDIAAAGSRGKVVLDWER